MRKEVVMDVEMGYGDTKDELLATVEWAKHTEGWSTPVPIGTKSALGASWDFREETYKKKVSSVRLTGRHFVSPHDNWHNKNRVADSELEKTLQEEAKKFLASQKTLEDKILAGQASMNVGGYHISAIVHAQTGVLTVQVDRPFGQTAMACSITPPPEK